MEQKTKGIITHISVATPENPKGTNSVCFEMDDAFGAKQEAWMKVAPNVVPFLEKLRKGEVEYSLSDDKKLVTFIKNIGFNPAYKYDRQGSYSAKMPYDKAGTTFKVREDVNACMLTSYAKDIVVAIISNSKMNSQELKEFADHLNMEHIAKAIAKSYKVIKKELDNQEMIRSAEEEVETEKI